MAVNRKPERAQPDSSWRTSVPNWILEEEVQITLLSAVGAEIEVLLVRNAQKINSKMHDEFIAMHLAFDADGSVYLNGQRLFILSGNAGRLYTLLANLADAVPYLIGDTPGLTMPYNATDDPATGAADDRDGEQ